MYRGGLCGFSTHVRAPSLSRTICPRLCGSSSESSYKRAMTLLSLELFTALSLFLHQYCEVEQDTPPGDEGLHLPGRRTQCPHQPTMGGGITCYLPSWRVQFPCLFKHSLLILRNRMAYTQSIPAQTAPHLQVGWDIQVDCLFGSSFWREPRGRLGSGTRQE